MSWAIRRAARGERVRTAIGIAFAVDTAKRNGAELIVMATHGHTDLAQMLIGSVAEKVVIAGLTPVHNGSGTPTPVHSAMACVGPP